MRLVQIFIFSIISSVIILFILSTISEIDVLSFKTINLMVFVSIIIINTIMFNLLYWWTHSISKTSNTDQQLVALKTAEKYRREFFGNVSHELKTPIFNIQGYVETLLDGALYDKSVNKKYLKRTTKSIERLIYIIKDLESITQLESEEINLEYSEWKLKHLVNDIIDQFEIKAKQKKITLLHDAKSTNILVYADKGKISQVLTNLISNSIKYGKHGGITKISSHQTQETCLVSIKDNGIGIAEKNIKRLFERFYRVDKSRSREQGGTGLGLAIVKHIIEAHNQDISVKSTVKKGTEFMFSINCKEYLKK